MRFRLRTLLLLVVFASIFLAAAVPFYRWLNSRPGRENWGYIGEVADIQRALGDPSLQDLRTWHLYGGWFGCDYLWQAKAPPEAISILTASLKLKPITVAQVPPEFWKMPPSRSETPSWWQPKQIPGGEYYMSPTFVPGDVRNEGIDGVVMYDPQQQRVWVWSQFDF
jgi:hypothetical protein